MTEIAGGVLAAVFVLAFIYWLSKVDWKTNKEISADKQQQLLQIQSLTDRITLASELAALSFDKQMSERQKQETVLRKKYDGKTESIEYTNELSELVQSHTLAHKMRAMDAYEKTTLITDYYAAINQLVADYEREHGSLTQSPATD